MKRIFTLLMVIFAFSFLNAQETYRFRADAPQGLNIESSTASGLSLHYALHEITVADYDDGDAQGQEIIMKGCFGSFAEGLPNLPFENHYIAIPKGAKVSVKVKENGCQTLGDINLLPAAEVILNNAAEQPKLRKDMSVFGKDANFPAENVTIAQTTQIRDLDVVMLSVTPFRYNPVRKTLEVIYDMDIEVCFEGGDGQFGDARYRNPAWDGILRDLVMNSNMLSEAHYYERLNEAIQNREEGCEYLIITLDDSAFMAWADTLKQFRNRQGILTKVITTADCGGNEPEDIRNYILNAYENWIIPPAAVLLFGGNHFTQSDFGLKPYILSSPPGWDGVVTYNYPTDNPFADMNGDSIPDLAISRMTVLNAEDCQLHVKKLLDYELTPPTDPHYYDHPVINSGYQDTKWFAITAQATNNFLRDRLGKHPANIYMKYWYEDDDPTPPDSIWSVAPNTDAVLAYFGPNGTQYLPSSIGYLDNWIDMLDKLPFQNAVNEGSFLTIYRDHSATYWWPCSDIEDTDIHSFHNERPTFLFSIGCSTNSYWDDASFGDCIADMFLHAETGALGSLGANTVTYSHYNDLTTWGMLDYFWPDYMPTLGSQTEPGFSYPSYSLVAGKLFLRQQSFLPYSTDTMKMEKTLNLFSYLGETYLNLYTDEPQPLSVEAPPYHANDQWQYTFTAEEGATVCLSHNNEIILVTRATGQPQSLTIPQMEVGEQFTFTTTKKNRFRYEQIVTVISAEYPCIYLKSYTLNDQNGNGQTDYGEYVNLDIHLTNIGQPAMEAGEITLFSESPYVEILQGATQYPPMENGASCSMNNAFKIKLANDVPDQTDILLSVHIVESENTHDDPILMTANAPLITIDREFRPMTAEGEPSTHIGATGTSYISFSVSNIGHAPTEYLNANFHLKAPFVSVETQPVYERLEPNEQRNIIFELSASPNHISGAWLQSQLDVQYGDYHSGFDTIIPYGGIFENFETDTLNPFFNWSNSSTHHWNYCNDDAYEGQRSFKCHMPDNYQTTLRSIPKNGNLVAHTSKISFHYKSNKPGCLRFNNSTHLEESATWKYVEITVPNRFGASTWTLVSSFPDGEMLSALIDDICFPPKHTTIAYAGDDIIACEESPVELVDAYAYDCDSMLWTTDGDGHFDYDTIANPKYFPGSQDLTNGNVTLTLNAYGNDTVVSTTQIHFLDEVSLGEIIGDNVVNKYSNPVSHYAIERQDGIRYLWQLEPAIAGTIYDHNDAIDILWNLYEGDAEVTLSVMADHSCTMEPVTKSISLIGYSTTEWHSTDFDLFPNPTDGKVNLVIGETLQGKAVVEVYNLLGERMMAKSIGRLQKGETISLDLSHLVSGLYIIKLSTENGSCTKKVSVW
jgi:hypothetical protein